jgi:hypothetical protein
VVIGSSSSKSIVNEKKLLTKVPNNTFVALVLEPGQYHFIFAGKDFG